MLQSLHRTWLALAVAGAAVLVVAFLSGRDFVHDVFPACAVTLRAAPRATPLGMQQEAVLSPVFVDTAQPGAFSTTRGFQLRYEESSDPRPGYGFVKQYSNVRLVWNDVDESGRPCACGTVPLQLSGEAPSDLRLVRVPSTSELFVVKGRTLSGAPDSDVRAAFVKEAQTSRHFQGERVFTMHHLSALVVLLAVGALGVALLRSRRAMSYAQDLHTWTEARLTPEGHLEDESGASLGTLEESRTRDLPAGPVLVAPAALGKAGLYRDMPIVDRQSVAEGTHERWASGTLVRLRDARVLAVISTMSTLLAFGARLLA